MALFKRKDRQSAEDEISKNPDQDMGRDRELAAADAAQYRELFERSADAILIIDGETFVECNQATVDMLRYRSREELLQTHPSELSPEFQPDGRASFEKANEMIAIAFDKGSHRFEWNHVRADGSVFPVEVLLTSVLKGNRKILHCVWRDITERKRLETELRQTQKMEAIGKLTGSIAHDFNNLLVAIIGYTELLQTELPEDSSFHEYVDQIQLAGNRAADLVAQLLAFGRKQVLQSKVIEFNDLLTNIEKLLSRVLGEDVEFVCRFHDRPLHVVADPGQLEQVVINLATNARDAMPGKGKLVMETQFFNLDEHSSEEITQLSHGSYAALSVTDTGEGIPAENLTKIFDPFFSTKGLHKGTGLGLSTVHGIVQQSGGDITVKSEVGVGSVFTVYLPITDEVPLPIVTEIPAIPVSGLQATETILLVEDEVAVSRLVETILLREGYVVHVAANGLEAQSLVDALDLRPDLLLTDVIMPEMGGPELARKLTQRFPDLKVLYASGYTDSALAHRGQLEDGVELLNKPFSPKDLINRVRVIFSVG